MLIVDVPDVEFFDSSSNEFIINKGAVLQLEHSLISLSLWESKWNKPFLSDKEMSVEETIDYIRCMTLNEVDPSVYANIDNSVIEKVIHYISLPMTATTFYSKEKPNKREVITNEIIYYWMISLGVPIECEKWHLSRLLTLIRVCSEKNKPKKKINKKEYFERQRALNEARRKSLKTKG